MKHHPLDIYPAPRGKEALYINESWLIDHSIVEVSKHEVEPEEDNIRAYIPLDINNF
ncbi:MAG: hypothetical protein R3Y58_13410 [Eubacteriales bacterium]